MIAAFVTRSTWTRWETWVGAMEPRSPMRMTRCLFNYGEALMKPGKDRRNGTEDQKNRAVGKAEQDAHPDRTKRGGTGRPGRHHVRPLRGRQQHTAGAASETVPSAGRVANYWNSGEECGVIFIGTQYQFGAKAST